MQKAKIKLKIEVSREFEDYMGEQYIEQVLMRVANRIVSELRWQIENPGLATEERFTIDKFNATIECGSGKRGTFAGVNFGSKTTASSSPFSGSDNKARLIKSNKQLENGKGTIHKLTEADDE